MKLFGKQWMALTFGGLILASSLNILVGFAAFKKLEQKAGAPIHGSFRPHPFLPTFTLKNLILDWQGRFRVLSGTVEVRYDPLFYLPRHKFRVRAEGHNLAVRLTGDLAVSQGLSEVKVDQVDVDLAFLGKGAPEIYLFDVKSRELQFHLVKDGQ